MIRSRKEDIGIRKKINSVRYRLQRRESRFSQIFSSRSTLFPVFHSTIPKRRERKITTTIEMAVMFDVSEEKELEILRTVCETTTFLDGRERWGKDLGKRYSWHEYKRRARSGKMLRTERNFSSFLHMWFLLPSFLWYFPCDFSYLFALKTAVRDSKRKEIRGKLMNVVAYGKKPSSLTWTSEGWILVLHRAPLFLSFKLDMPLNN